MNTGNTSPSPNAKRKLSRNWRRANFVYQLTLGAIGGANVLLAALNGTESINVPLVYFEVLCVLESFIPLAWSKLLDMVKEYTDQLTPATTPLASSPDTTMRRE